MMNVQTMRYVVDMLRPGEVPDIVHLALMLWSGEQPAHVRSSANHIFRFLRGGKPYYLRLVHDSERSRESIEAELDFILHCAAHGLAVARPVLSGNGRYVEDVRSPNGIHYAVVFEGLEGEQYESDDWSEAQVRACGRTLARLHQASQSFAKQPVREAWQDQIRNVLRTLPPEEGALARLLDSGLGWLDTLQDQDYGLIHGDFEADNLVWDGEQPQILDFDAAMYALYAVDIAISLNDLSAQAQHELFLEGYAEIRPLPDGIREQLPRYWNLLLAVKIAQVLHAYSTTPDEGNPEWVTIMRERHKNWLAAKRALVKWD